MDEQDRIDRLIEAVDRLVLEGETPEEEEESGDIAPYLVLAVRLKEEMPPVQPDPAFAAQLRARLMAQPRVPHWRRWLGRLLPGAFGVTEPPRHQDTKRWEGEAPAEPPVVRDFPLPLGEDQGEGDLRLDVGAGLRPAPARNDRQGDRSTFSPSERAQRRTRPAWGYAFATAAAALVVAGTVVVYQGTFTGQSTPMAAQPAVRDATAAPAGTTQPESLAASAPAPGAQPAPPAALRSAVEPSGAETAMAQAAPAATTGGAYAPEAALAAKAPSLPALPPISSSSPPAIMGGMGGAPMPGEVTPSRQIRFERATTLPELGPQVTVYRYQPPVADIEANRDLAARLGFYPSGLRPIEGAEGAYVVAEPGRGSLEIHGPGGAIVYHSEAGSTKPEQDGAESPIQDGRAIEIATNWLRESGLLPTSTSTPQVTLPYPEAAFKDVTLRPAEPENIVTDNPKIRVSVDAAGQVLGAYILWPEVESTLEYDARTAQSAWALLEAGKAEMRFEGEHNRPDLDVSVLVMAAETGYAITFSLDGQAYLQPVVVFSGESSGGGETLPFSAWAPAVGDAAVSGWETRYVLATSLPEVPPELSAFQPVYEAPSEEWVRQQGLRLGLSGEPQLVDDGERRFWEVRDRAGEWLLLVPADAKSQAGASERWSFGRVGQPLDGLGTAPSGEDAVRIATDFLKNHRLYTPDLGDARAEPAAPDGSATIVIFEGNGQGIALDGRGVLSVTINGRGEVHRVMSNQLPMKAVKTAPALSPEEALELVQAGDGMLVVPSLFGRQVYSDMAEIDEVELVYLPGVAIGQAPDPVTGLPVTQYEPYYRFSGTMEVGESRRRVPFTVSISAWAK